MAEAQIELKVNTTPFEGAIKKIGTQFEALANRAGNAKGFHKVSHQFEGLGSALARAQDPMQALIAGGERLAGIMRIAFGPIGIAILAAQKLYEVIQGNVKAAKDFQGALEKSYATKAGDSVEDLTENLKALQAQTDEMKKQNKFAQYLAGYDTKIAKQQIKALHDAIDSLQAKKIEHQTSFESQNKDDAVIGKRQLVEDDYREKIAKAREQGNLQTVEALEKEKAQKILNINAEYQKQEEREQDEIRKENLKKEIDAIKQAAEAKKKAEKAKNDAINKQFEADYKQLSEDIEDVDKRAALKKQLLKETEAKQKTEYELGQEFAKSREFNGAVSSTRKLGFGGGVGQSNHQQTLKKMDDQLKNLRDISAGIVELKNKINGV